MTHNTGNNFDFIKFCIKAKMLDIICYQIFIEAHWSIKKVEKYHIPIHHIYIIICTETQSIIFNNAKLQMVFKAVNDITRPDDLILTLFIIVSYHHIIIDLPPSLSRTIVIPKAMSNLGKLKAQQGV